MLTTTVRLRLALAFEQVYTVTGKPCGRSTDVLKSDVRFSKEEAIMTKIIALFACGLVSLGIAAAQENPNKAAGQGIKVEKIVAAASVDKLEPVGENTEFDASVGTVSCWTKVSAKTVPATIKHVWYFGDKKVFEQSLDLKFPSTRTWSSKSVKSGSWKVEVTDDAGAVLSSVTFTVK